MHRSHHHLLLIWLIFTGIVAFGFVVAWNEGLISSLVLSDRSNITYGIGLLYIIGSIHSATRFIILSNETNIADRVVDLIRRESNDSFRLVNSKIQTNKGHVLPDGIVSRYLSDVIVASMNNGRPQDGNSANQSLSEVYASHLKGPHEYGWFMVDVMIKLGLLGTITGFIFMLCSVTNTATLDVNTMQNVLKQMSSGMGAALYTTLAGLIGSVMLAVQYHIIDRRADTLLARTIHMAELHVRQPPALVAESAT